MRVESIPIAEGFLQVNLQPEVGNEGYDRGAVILQEFFERTLQQFNQPELSEKGKRILQCCLDRGSVPDYADLMGRTEAGVS